MRTTIRWDKIIRFYSQLEWNTNYAEIRLVDKHRNINVPYLSSKQFEQN